jgi:ABC-2 type transport system permease protein
VSSFTGTDVLARLAARRDRLMLPVWIYVIVIFVVSTGYSFKHLYKTPASREAITAGIVHDPATLAIAGPIYGNSVGSPTRSAPRVPCWRR